MVQGSDIYMVFQLAMEIAKA